MPAASTAHAFLLRAIQAQGWDPEKDVTITVQTPEVGGSALKANQIDAHPDFRTIWRVVSVSRICTPKFLMEEALDSRPPMACRCAPITHKNKQRNHDCFFEGNIGGQPAFLR